MVGMMFYWYISENLTNYINEGEEKEVANVFTSQEVTQLLTVLVVVGKTEVNKVYEIKPHYLIQINAA